MSDSAGRKSTWILIASILGSGAVFLEGTVVLVAVPSIGKDLGLGMSGLQWVLNGYLLTLSALILFGGALGDRISHQRVFGFGLIGFALSSLGCALAPNILALVTARVVQGISGALVVPNSLAMLETAFSGKARGVAIGRWAAWSGISTAIGPLAGGWLVDQVSWRFVFVSVVPFSIAAAWIALSRSDVTKTKPAKERIDYLGSALVTLGLAGVIAALIVAPDSGFKSSLTLTLGLGGIAMLVAFVIVESRAKNPVLPLDVFKSRQFVGANLNTVFVYAGLNGLFFLLMLEMQNRMGYSALKAGASLLPINALLLILSPRTGKLAARIGPRVPMAVGSLVAGLGSLLFMRMTPHASYMTVLFPAIVVFGVGLGMLVAPLTAAALQALADSKAGIASAVNNAAARLAGLLATAAIPLAVGIGGSRKPSGAALDSAFGKAMLIVSALCGIGAIVAFLMIRGGRDSAKEPR